MPSTPKSSKGRTRSKSPARGARSRSRSRGRSKSPARKPRAESKSPSRKPRAESKSPARKSPSRKAKAEEVNEAMASKQETTEVNEVTMAKTTTEERTTAVLRSSTSVPTRQSARIASMNSQKDYTDSKQEIRHVSSSMEKKTKKMFENGGPVVTFLMTLLLPVLILAVNFACNKTSCSLNNILDINLFPRSLDAYFDKESLLMVVGFHAFVAALSALPVGQIVDGPVLKAGRRLYVRRNGFFVLMVVAATFVCMWYFHCGVTLVYQKYHQLLAVSILHSFLAGVKVYLRATRVPTSQLDESGNTGCVTHDFFVGRELNPRFWNLDVKMVVVRMGLGGWFVLNLAFLAQSYEMKQSIDYTLLLAVVLQNMYIADRLFFEDSASVSMGMAKQGAGFAFIFGFEVMVPFVYTVTTRYLLEHPQNWSWYWLSAFALFHLAGYVIFRGSNSQKFHFRRNPNDPAFANMETIPTSAGKGLLVSGWWGLLRHPNYLGDWIMTVTWSALCGCSSCLVYFYPVFLFLMFIDRSITDGKWCQEKYGAAWDRYCQRVRYRMIPYVF